MRRSKRFLIKRAVYDYGKDREHPRKDWILANLGMVCLAAGQIWWTAEVEEIFLRIRQGDKNAMKEFLNQQNKQIDDLVDKSKYEWCE